MSRSRNTKTGIEYFSHDVDMLQDRKIKLIKAKHGLIGYAVYLRLLEELYQDKGYFLSVDEDFTILFCDDNNIECALFETILHDCLEKELFDKNLFDQYNILTSSRIQLNYCAATERRKDIVFINEYLLVNPKNEYKSTNVNIISLNVDIESLNVNILQQSKVKESKVNIILNTLSDDEHPDDVDKNINVISPVQENLIDTVGDVAIESETDIDDKLSVSNDKPIEVLPEPAKIDPVEESFEKAWKLYPEKAGKGSIKRACKVNIHNLGDEFIRCIERYIRDTALRRNSFPELKYKNGSTFFNSGYVDYLDENYVEYVEPVIASNSRGKPVNKFADYEQRNYDYEALERIALEQRMASSKLGGRT